MGKGKHYKSTAAYQKYGKLIYNDCLKRLKSKQLADEAEQEVFLRLSAKGPDFQPPTKLIAWLREAARIVCLEILRRERMQRKYEKFIAPFMIECHPSDHESEDRDAVAKMLESLSEEDREMLKLRFWEGKEWEDVAQDLKTTLAAVKMRFGRICEKLREQFPDLGNDK